MIKKTITEDQLNDMYDEMLERTKQNWIKNYNGADILTAIDSEAYDVGLMEYEFNMKFKYQIKD